MAQSCTHIYHFFEDASGRRDSDLLIVNGDDLGMTTQSTDAILEAHRRGLISSATAMVYCSDSQRAAELAKEAHLPVGLHLNLTEVFTSASVPSSVRKRQAIAVRRLGANKYARWFLWPELASIMKLCVTDQLEEFGRLYGTPTHIDGHHHIHISANVLAANALPTDLPLRRSFTFEKHERSAANRAFRKVINLFVSWRWQSSARFLDINDFVGAQSAAVRKVQHADSEVVEVMCHPEVASDWAFLTSDAWASILTRYQLGSYEALNLRRRS